MLKLINELEVHQIELEMQCDELMLAKKQAEAATEKYTELYDYAPTGYFTLSKEGSILEINFSAARILNKQRSHLLNSRFGFFVSNDSRPSFNHFIDSAFISNANETCEVTLTLDGMLPIYVQLTGIAPKNGEQCFINMVDITESKNIMKAMEQTSAQLALATLAGGVGLWDYDIVNNILLWDNKMFELYGVEKKSFAGGYESWRAGLHPDDMERCDAEIHKAIRGEKEFNTEFRLLLPNGSVRYIRAGAIVQRDGLGNPLRMIGTNWDITSQKNMEKALRESEVKFRTVADYTYDWEYWEGTDSQIIYISPSCERITGYKPMEFISDRLLIKRIVHAEDAKLFYRHFKKTHPLEYLNTVEEMDFRIIKKNGSVVHISHLCRPVFDGKGNYLGRRISNRDITERKHAEELLAQTQQNYEIFFNTIDDFLFVLDIQGNVIHINTTVTNRLGYTEEELFGKSILMIHPPARRDEAGRIVGEMLSRKASFCPVPIVTKSGIQIPVETRVSHGIWNGKPAIFGVTKDISKITLSEEKFSKLFHINPSACGLTDLNTRKYIEVNDAFHTLLGFDKNEVIGKTSIELGILTAETLNELLLKEDNNGNLTNAEVGIKAKNGDTRHVLMSSENIYIQDTKYRFTVVNDITERKKAEEALRESEEKQRIASLYARSLIEASLDPLVTIDAHGKITDVNTATENATGLTRNELIGTDFSDYFTEQAKAKIVYQKVFEQGKVVDYPITIRHSSNKLIDVLYNASVYHNEDGKILGVLASARDITERKRIEEEIKLKNDQLNLLNAEKDKFFSIIAHDLRSPFQTLLGFSPSKPEELLTYPLEKVQRLAINMRTSANKLFNLIENLLEWSQMQRGLISFNPKSINISDKIGDIVALIRDTSDKKMIDISISIADDLTVLADKQMFESVVRNLVFNAVKFTHNEGKITISAHVTTNSSVEISITDTGIGMNKNIIDNLFRLDANIGRKGTEGEPSTGLGLIICKDFIEKHGGRFWVESEVGKGSTFRFTLPGQTTASRV